MSPPATFSLDCMVNGTESGRPGGQVQMGFLLQSDGNMRCTLVARGEVV
jgi:hypothetical protein